MFVEEQNCIEIYTFMITSMIHLIHLLQTNAVTRMVSISFLGSCYPSRHSEYPTTVTPGYLLVPGGHCHQACVFKSTSSSGADPGFEKGGFDVVPKSDTGGATHNYL